MNIAIREAAENDLNSILKILSQLEMDDGKEISLEKAKDTFHKMGKYPFFKVFVAVLDGEVVGTFELLIMDNLAHQALPSGIIEDVAVARARQGQGIGKEMMSHAVKICREMGCYKVALSSHLKRHDAHRFYESLGFQKHGFSFYVDLI